MSMICNYIGSLGSTTADMSEFLSSNKAKGTKKSNKFDCVLGYFPWFLGPLVDLAGGAGIILEKF